MDHVYVSAIHISVFAIHTTPKNQDFRCLLTDVRVSGRPKITVFGPKWVAVNSHGLKLWENDATGLRIILKVLFWQAGAKQIYKNLPIYRPGGWIYDMSVADK